MQSRRPETTAGAPGKRLASPPDQGRPAVRREPRLLRPEELEPRTRGTPPRPQPPVGDPLPPARSTRHLRSLLWWGLVIGVAIVTFREPHSPPPATGPVRQIPRPEREAFLALSFPRISETIPEALPATVFREQMTALKKAGYSPISLADVDAFFHKRTPLPDRPVVLLFSEAQRETMEIADATLASLDMRGVFFVNLPGVQDANVDLVSKHRLVQLIDSGRWDAGLDSGSGAVAGEAEAAPQAFPAEDYRKARQLLEKWIERPVLAIAEQRQRFDDSPQGEAWGAAIGSAGFALGFVLAPSRANYVDESASLIRSVRVARDWSGTELVAQLAAREPRRQRFADDFKPPNPSPAWVVDHGEVAIDDGSLKIAAREGQRSALVWLAGTERWKDASVTVALAAAPKGQFWITLRNRGSAPFLRLGVSAGRAMLQKTGGDGETHEVAARSLGRGAVALTLRMIGDRAEALVDGEPMMERPAEIPPGMTQGAVTLAVWSPQGEASARIRHVETGPLSPTLALLTSSPDEAAWSELRRRATELSILSPRGDGSQAVEIFARYHRLHIFPALVVDHRPSPTETRRLVDEAVRSAGATGVDGINLVIHPSIAATGEARDLVSNLRARLNEKKKPLIVTVLGAPRSVPHGLDDLANVFVLNDERASRFEVAEEPIRLVEPGA